MWKRWKRIHLVLAMTALLMSSSARAEDWIKFNPRGDFIVDGDVHGAIFHYDAEWRLGRQNDGNTVIRKGTGADVEGTIKSGDQRLEFTQRCSRVSDTEWSLQATVKHEPGIETQQLCLALLFPIARAAGRIVRIDDTDVALPEEHGATSLFSTKPARRVAIPLSRGWLVFEGDLNVMVQDNRAFRGDTYAVRLNFTPASGVITTSLLQTTVRLEPFDAKPISLASAVNMGFADDRGDDRQGGWTDQGPNNDLRMLQPGTKRFGGIPFDILDPARNNGKSCLVMAGPERDYFVEQASVDGQGQSFRYLYLLHTAAWARSDQDYVHVRVLHTDGSESAFNIKGKRDVNDWWAPHSVENGAMVWTAENRSAYVGLFLSRFPIEHKPIRSIAFASTGQAVWILVGLAGSNDDVPLPSKSQEDVYIVAGKDWRPFEHSLDVEPGSALDMTFLTSDGPAGKYGRVIVGPAGDFRFENAPEKKVRFYGTNLCFTANYLEKQESERLATRLAACGYNSVRFHHHDNGMIDAKAPDSLTLDPAQLDRLDYLFHCLKQKGIYITTDVFVSRNLKPSEAKELQEPNRRGRDVKELAPLSDAVMTNIQTFATKWLKHVNPYTGIAWKDDPALFSIAFVNENTLYSIWDNLPGSKELYRSRALEQAQAQNRPLKTAHGEAAALTQFVTEMQIRSYEEMKKHVGGTLGCKALFSDCNMSAYLCQTLARDRFDYVDNHGYWDHPSFPVKQWSLPYGFRNQSVLRRFCAMPGSQMVTRVFGKPFTFTEFNYVFPNDYRSEGNAVMGALAAFQDWGGVYRFAYAHNRTCATELNAGTGFDTATDPLTLLGERIVALLYLRQDVAIGRKAVPFVVTPECATNLYGPAGAGPSFPDEMRYLGLVHRIGSNVLRKEANLPDDAEYVVAAEKIESEAVGGRPVYAGDKLLERLVADGRLDKAHYDAVAGTARSDTGEIMLDSTQNTFTVVTERSECLVLPAGLSLAGDKLRVANSTTYCSVFASGLDGKALGESKRVLLLHLTDIKNTKTRFAGSDGTLLLSRGELPHLVRKGTATVALRHAGPSPTVYALSVTGKRLGRIDVEKTAGGFSFIADTDGPHGACMAYEAIWNEPAERK